MLKKINRLTREKDFQAVYRRGRYFQTAFFSVNFLPSRGVTRVGVVVSKKITKKATERNLIKRRTREIVATLLPQIIVPTNIIVSIKKPALETDYKALEKDLTFIFSKLGLTK